MGFLVCALMKHTNLVDIGRLLSLGERGLGEDTIQSTWASRTHTPPQRPLKGPGRACEGALRSCFVLLYSAPVMPRDGANLLSDVRVPVSHGCLRTVRATRAVRRREADEAKRSDRQAHRSATGARGRLPQEGLGQCL